MAGPHHHSKRAEFKAEFERGGAVRDFVQSALQMILEAETAAASGAAKSQRIRADAA